MSGYSLKRRLTMNMVAIFSIVMIATSSIIYFAYKNSMVETIIDTLENKTLLSAFYYLEEDEVSPYEHENIRNKLRKSISRKDIGVYTLNGQQIKGKINDKKWITPRLFKTIQKDGRYFFSNKTHFYYGLFYKDNEGDFIVITRESKQLFTHQLQSLLSILFVVSLCGILIIYLLSLYIGKFAYSPIQSFSNQLKYKNISNIDKQIRIKNSYKELDEMVSTYNQFASIISQTFTIQKNFTDYLSHEIKTPVSAILGVTEVELKKAQSSDDIEIAVSKIQKYINDLEETINNMLLLSSSTTTDYQFDNLRIDEVIWEVVENTIEATNRNIYVHLYVTDSRQLIVSGNKRLLESALHNLIENAIKYSKSPVDIEINAKDGHIVIRIIDHGIGIEPEDIHLVTQNFVRGKNTKDYQGKGIGLSLATIVFQLHAIKMDILSDSQGTTIQLTF